MKIYGMNINGTEIDKALAPDGMTRTDWESIYNAGVDVPSLPGGWNPSKATSQQKEEIRVEAQRMADLTATLLATVHGKVGQVEIQHTSFGSGSRHMLGKIKDKEGIFLFAKKLMSSREDAFRYQDDLLEHFLLARHYPEQDVEDYLQAGGLPHLIRTTFNNFYDLACHIRQLAFDHQKWTHSAAQAMLEFHSEKLLSIRKMAPSRKLLLLRTYIHLQDSAAK